MIKSKMSKAVQRNIEIAKDTWVIAMMMLASVIAGVLFDSIAVTALLAMMLPPTTFTGLLALDGVRYVFRNALNRFSAQRV